MYMYKPAGCKACRKREVLDVFKYYEGKLSTCSRVHAVGSMVAAILLVVAIMSHFSVEFGCWLL